MPYTAKAKRSATPPIASILGFEFKIPASVDGDAVALLLALVTLLLPSCVEDAVALASALPALLLPPRVADATALVAEGAAVAGPSARVV